MYIVQATILNVKYYLHVFANGEFRLEGLKDNATCYPTFANANLARIAMQKEFDTELKINTELEIITR